jgi:hypothetical protein
MNKEWREVPGYGGEYIVSNNGEVRSLFCGHGTRWKCGERTLTQGVDWKGYKKVTICKNGHTKRVFVHRLVAEAFLEKPQGKNIINHKDGNKQNNNVDNLEWCTDSENQIHSYRVLGNKKPKWLMDLLKEKSSKPVRCIETGIEYPSISEAARSVGVKTDTHIGEVCRGEAHKASGYHWEFI